MPVDEGALLAPYLAAIATAYGLNIIDYAPAGEDWRILTDQGPRVALLLRHRETRAAFVSEIYAHLNRQSWPGVANLVRTAAGEPFLTLAPKLAVVLTEAPPWRPLPRLGPRAFRGVADALAQLHARTRQLTLALPQSTSFAPVRGPVVLQEEFRERVDDLAAYEVVARHRLRPGPFDRSYIRVAPHLLREAKAALGHLASEPWTPDGWSGVICLGDFNLANFASLPSKPGARRQFCIASLAKALIDMGARDLARLILLGGESSRWNPRLALAILDAYRRRLPLSPPDRAALLAWLTFPYEAWRLTDCYYRRQEEWSERVFTARLEATVAELPARGDYVVSVGRLIAATSE